MIWSQRGLNEFLNPLTEARRAHQSVERLFESLLPSPRPRRAVPPTNLSVSDDALLLRAEVPGYGPGDVELNVDRDVLTLSGTVFKETPEAEVAPEGEAEVAEAEPTRTVERSFRRRFRLPFRVEVDEIQANLRHGILEVRLPKAQEDRPRRIEVRS